MRRIGLLVASLLVVLPVTAKTTAVARLKDVATLRGIPSEPLIGYGLVVGLNKTGDRRQTIFPAQTLAAMTQAETVYKAALGAAAQNARPSLMDYLR